MLSRDRNPHARTPGNDVGRWGLPAAQGTAQAGRHAQAGSSLRRQADIPVCLHRCPSVGMGYLYELFVPRDSVEAFPSGNGERLPGS